MDHSSSSLCSTTFGPFGPFGPFAGKGSQAAAIEAASAAGAAFPLVVQVNRCEFYSFIDLATRDAFLEAHRDHELIERVDGSRPFRAVVDVDGPEDLDEISADLVISEFTSVALDWGVPADNAAPLVVRGRRPGKASLHLIADGWQVADGPAGRRFAEEVAAALPNALRAFIDVKASGGSASFGMRLPWCPKLMAPGGPPIPGSVLEPDEFGEWGSRVAPWCLQGLQGGEGSVHESSAVVDDRDMDPPPEEVAPAAAKPLPVLDDAVLEAFVRRIAAEFPHLTRGDDVGGLPAFIRVRTAECASCGRPHDREGAYITQSAETGTLFLNCRRAGPGADALLVHAVVDKPMPDADEFDAAPVPDTTAVQRYNSDAFAKEIGGGEDLYVRAPWKTGKTVFAGHIIRSLIKSDPEARVLAITCRKTLSSALCSEFGATDYRSIKGDFTEDLARRHPVSVWQLESLRRIPSELRGFDLVIVDEPGADFAHVFQPNANAKSRGGLSKARALVAKAKRVYVSDNDLTAAHVEAFKAIRPGKSARVLVNSYRSWDGVGVRVSHGKTAPAVVRKRLFDFLDAQAEAREAGRPWTGCAIPCHSRKVAAGIAEEVRQRYGPTGVKLYTSESDQHEKAQDFANATNAWADVLAIVYTASLSVGVSATTEHVSHCFGFFTAGNAGVAQSCQMLFRARELRGIEIAFDGRPVHDLPQTQEQLFRWATVARNRGAIPDQFRADLMPAGVFDAETQEDPDALARVVNGAFEGRAWVCDQLERHRSARWFVPRMVRTLEAAGCVVVVEQVGRSLEQTAAIVGITAEALKATNEAATEATAAAELMRDEMASKELSTALAEFEDRVATGGLDDEDSRLLTAPEIQGRRALQAIRAYAEGGGLEPSEVTDLSDEDRAAWLGHHAKPQATKAYRALTSIVRGVDHLHTPDATGEVQTATTSSAEACAIVRRAFEAVGCTAALLEGVEGIIAVADLATPSPGLARALDEINEHSLRVFGSGDAARRRKALATGFTAKKVVGTLDVALKFVGATLRPTYRTERDRLKRQNAQGYKLTWNWLGPSDADRAPPPPAPCPRHPARR